ncbi:MAG: class I SAM-dependent methyltransferase [Burkholderiales bacterium]|nr:class I SAM-dependent methyltransferase [Burkholderiales bacterium]
MGLTLSDIERERIEAIAADSRYGTGVNADMVRYSYRIFQRHLRPGSVLEMGPAEGLMTDLLAASDVELTVVEGAEAFCRALAARHPHIEVVHALFEQYSPSRRFDNIILGHVLEHVADPVDILRRAHAWLAPGGRVMAAVPNARSLHRQAAVLMGLLPAEDALNEADLRHGHRRVFNPESFRQVFLQAGYEIEVFGGYWIKPVSNAQIEAHWTPQMLEAFMQLGERYPDIAAELYVIAHARGEHAAE